MTRIFLISNMYPCQDQPFFGIFVKNFYENISSPNIEVSCKSLIYGRGREIFGRMVKYVIFYFSVLRNFTLSWKYDIIYIHYPTHSALPILPFLPFIRKEIFLNFHGSDITSTGVLSTILKFLLKPIVRFSHTIVVPSQSFKEIVREEFSIAAEKIMVSPSGGIDFNLFKPVERTKAPEEPFLVGFVGRLDKGKGWDILLKALKLLENKVNFKCMIVGAGLEEKNLHLLVDQLELQNRVSILGAIDHDLLPDFYNSLDVFVFPTSLCESLGLVGIEALACGIPVIGSRIGELKNYIIEGLNGEMFEVQNYKELADKIKLLYVDADLRKAYGAAARKSVRTYDQNIISAIMNSKLESIKNGKV